MTYSQLNYFIEVARCGNFTYAAERLFITTPSLSKYISSLEEELGFKLFNRKSRGVELTEDGYRFYNYIDQPFHDLNAAYSRAVSLIKEKQNSIIIAVPDDEKFPPALSSLIYDFNKTHKPSTKVIIKGCPINELYKGLIDKSFDLIIANEIYVKTVVNVSYYILDTANMCIALRKDHPLANSESIKLSDLQNECLIVAIPKNGYDFMDHQSNKLSSFSSSVLNVDTLQDALMNVAIGNGVALVPNTAIDISNPVIKRIPAPKRINESHYCVAWCTDNPNPMVLKLANNIKSTIDHLQND